MNPLFRDSFPSSGAGGPPDASTRKPVDYARLMKDARAAIDAGRIPSRHADQMWGGSGSGGVCAICGHRLERTDVEYELDFTDRGRAASYHVHVSCCMAWEAELS
jgi:hypothetical protein